jgi:hypothetical protein
MDYVRRAIDLALNQLTPMHSIRAIIALTIGIMFPQMALARTNAVHVIINPIGNTPQTGGTCTQASCQTLVPRYDKVTGMLGILEYDVATCTENTPGQGQVSQARQATRGRSRPVLQRCNKGHPATLRGHGPMP